ncbi:ATP-citrate synthase alpha chain protein 3 [Sesamum alatum]|uniref:ATP-citrate synthase alpha chain protein 3 n=1 Tax=Sesamum alatum TaxID=300844 RepID=A0AAE1YB19_9LAMI|nr:ATP-citrate synthase alpha chain protein 3 [Sesamum alatum]
MRPSTCAENKPYTPDASPPPSDAPGPTCTPHAPAPPSYAPNGYTPDAPPPPSYALEVAYAPEVVDTLDAAPDAPLPSYDADVGSYDAPRNAAKTLDVVPDGPAPSHYLDTGSYDIPARVPRRSRRQKVPTEKEEGMIGMILKVVECATADPDGPKRALVIGGGIANFTDVAATFSGIFRALKEKIFSEEFFMGGLKFWWPNLDRLSLLQSAGPEAVGPSVDWNSCVWALNCGLHGAGSAGTAAGNWMVDLISWADLGPSHTAAEFAARLAMQQLGRCWPSPSCCCYALFL